MPDNATNAATALANLWSRVAELDTVPLTERARLSYQDDNGRSFGWNEYRAALMKEIQDIQGARAGESSLLQQTQPPFTIWD
jgi:hypothetical protein